MGGRHTREEVKQIREDSRRQALVWSKRSSHLQAAACIARALATAALRVLSVAALHRVGDAAPLDVDWEDVVEWLVAVLKTAAIGYVFVHLGEYIESLPSWAAAPPS